MQYPTLHHPTLYRCRLWTGLACIWIACAAGCAADKPTLLLTNSAVHRQVRQEFTRAYATRDGAGEYQIMLVANPIDDLPMPSPGEVIQPSATSSIHQVLQIRMLWRPIHGTKPDFPAATNAVLHWYIFGPSASPASSPNTPDSAPSFLHYAGNGFVDVYSGSSKVDVDVRAGNLKLIDRRGDLSDPVGACVVNGKFQAVIDDQRVGDAVEEIKAQGVQTPAAPRDFAADVRSSDGPPPRGTAP